MKLAAAFLLGALFAAYANWWRELLTNLRPLPRASGAKGTDWQPDSEMAAVSGD